ncbi:hypothetical protein ACP4OV_012413 [Aristida adscensionis]
MVWKAAAQTRFRVFKHENGISVRVIACFQPLQNCRVLPPSPQARDVVSRCSHLLLLIKLSVLVFFSITIEVEELFTETFCCNSVSGCLFMGDKAYPWCHWPNQPWKFNIENTAGNLYLPDVGLADTNLVSLPAYLNPVAGPVSFFTAPVADRPLPMAPRFVTTMAPSLELSAAYPPHNKSLVFYQKENPAPLLGKRKLDPVPELQGSNETNVTDVGAENTEGIHENTDEINALLDSDSDEGYQKVHELGTVRHSPVENDTLSVESVASAGASAGASRPSKKRRLSSGTDKSVVDTASSARPDHSVEQKLLCSDCDAESCCIGEVESDHKFAAREGGGEEAGDSPEDRERRRERIQETVSALRNIVPGGIAKDATAVLDEAICYLQYLKLKVKTLGAVSL